METYIELLSSTNPSDEHKAILGLLSYLKTDKKDEVRVILLDHYVRTENEMARYVIEKEIIQTFTSLDGCTKQSHPLVDEKYKDKIIHGDNKEVMKGIPDRTVHFTVTSPPYYNAREYSTYSSYKGYLREMEEVFTELFRITKDGRYVAVNTSPVIEGRLGRKYASKRYPIPMDLNTIMQNIGWEYVDDIQWVKPEYTVKNRVSNFNRFRKPLSYKPNTITESIVIYRKKSYRLPEWYINSYPKETIEESKVDGEIQRTNVWEITPVRNKEHNAVFPEELVKYLIQYYSFKGDLVFDMYGGSGTTGKVAKDLQRHYLMIEQKERYVEYAKKRLYKDE